MFSFTFVRMKSAFRLLPASMLILGIVLQMAIQPTHAVSQEEGLHNWTIYSGTWEIMDGWLSATAPTRGESWIWAGNPPLVTSGNLAATLTVKLETIPDDGIGRPGGIIFYASTATQRLDSSMNGYTLDWIDRVE